MQQIPIDDIRDFNRFYARLIGLLDKTYVNSDYSLAEVRVLGEIYHHKDITANDILTTLQLDKGYLSRIIKSYEKKKMLIKKRSPTDGRAINLELTDIGKETFEQIDKAAILQVSQAFAGLREEEYHTLVASMKTIKELLKNK